MTNNSTGYVSVIGPNLMEAVLELVEKLESTTPVEPDEVMTSAYENGLSCAIAVLSINVLESALNSVRRKRKDVKEDDAADYFDNVTANTELGKDIDEAIAVRDAIVHNHLWEGQAYWDDTYTLKHRSSPQLLTDYGNRRLRRVMNPKTRLSRRLKLNLMPLRIWRQDAYTVLKIVVQAVEALEPFDLNFKMSQRYYKFQNELQSFNSIIGNLPY